MKEPDDDGKRFAVETATAETFRDIQNDFINWDDLKNLMATVFTDHAKLRVWFEIIKEWRAGNQGAPMYFPRFEELRDELRMFWNHRVNESDDLTRIAVRNYKTSLWDDFQDYNPRMLLRPILAHDGRMYHIWGIPGSGKTDFALKLIEIVLEENHSGKRKFSVITNIYCENAQLVRFGKPVASKFEIIPNFYRTVRMTDMLLLFIQEKRKGHSIVVAWDEISTWAHKQDAPSKSNIDLSRLVRLIRKFSGNIFFLEQIDEGLMGQVDEMLVVKVHKSSQKRMQFLTRNLERNYNKFLDNVPRTKLKFYTGDVAGFRNDVDFKDMFNVISIEDQGDRMADIEAYITKQMATATKKKPKRPRRKAKA